MSFEVEMKFPVTDAAPVIERLLQLGAARERTVHQSDTYFNLPQRDFAETDEAFRIRSVDGRHRVTYKGPLLDEVTKTRREIEVPLGDAAENGQRFAEILTALGFREVATVRKRRALFSVNFEGRPFEACADSVDRLGEFIELETVTEAAGLDAARNSVQRLAAALGLENSERRSYLALLLQRRDTGQDGNVDFCSDSG